MVMSKLKRLFEERHRLLCRIPDTFMNRDLTSVLRPTVDYLRHQHASMRWVGLTTKLLGRSCASVMQVVIAGTPSRRELFNSLDAESVHWMVVDVAATISRVALAGQLNALRATAPRFLALSQLPRLLKE